jgi:hypothetical protein
LIIESIKIYGHDVKYVVREVQNKDRVYGEDTQTSKYTRAIPIEMYIKNVDGFQGDGDFLSKFNLQIRDQITFTVARRIFTDEVGGYFEFARPREGDLIYFPLNRKVFEIKFVEHEPIFYQMGALQMYDLKCELFEYNSEVFETGDNEIDAMYQHNFLGKASIFNMVTDDRYNNVIVTEGGDDLSTEGDQLETVDTAAENDTIENEALEFLDFSEINPFTKGSKY